MTAMSTDAAASRPWEPVDTIRTPAEAVEVAGILARGFAEEAAERDRERRLPRRELEELSRSGLLAVTVPHTHGGAEVPAVTLGTVVRLLAAADGSIGQIPQNHFFFVEVLRENGTPDQQHFFFSEVLAGKRFGNAIAEPGAANALEFATTIRRRGAHYRVDGAKYYSTGALLADWIPV